jgi:hypothetical protein
VVKSAPAKIISLTREPFSRNESSFFEWMKRMRIRPGRKIEDFTVEELIALYINKFDQFEVLTWFDVELRRITGFDVYDHELTDNEYMSAKKDRFDILVLKCELPDEKKEKLISEFMGLDDFRIVNANITGKQSFSELYRQFRTRVSYSRELVDKIAGSKYFRHFYDDDRESILEGLRIT